MMDWITRMEHSTERELDKFDLAILSHLQRDARLTNADLAEKVGLSPAPCWRRVRRLEQQGYILGYHAELDRSRVGLGVVAFVRLHMNTHNQDAVDELLTRLSTLQEVLSVHHISSDGAFEITVVATDLEHYSRLAREVLNQLPHVKDIHTSFSLGEVKNSRVLPLEHLEVSS